MTQADEAWLSIKVSDHDQHRIFGAICAPHGTGAALVLPQGSTEGMALHLAATSEKIAPGRQAARLLNQGGWHVSAKLRVPANITIMPLPPKCSELNPQENIWRFMRDNWLSNRVCRSRDAIVDPGSADVTD